MFCSDFEIDASKAEADDNNAEANEAIEADANETDEADKANEVADEAEAD
jgi:hypothetical protein